MEKGDFVVINKKKPNIIVDSSISGYVYAGKIACSIDGVYRVKRVSIRSSNYIDTWCVPSEMKPYYSHVS